MSNCVDMINDLRVRTLSLAKKSFYPKLLDKASAAYVSFDGLKEFKGYMESDNCQELIKVLWTRIDSWKDALVEAEMKEKP